MASVELIIRTLEANRNGTVRGDEFSTSRRNRRYAYRRLERKFRSDSQRSATPRSLDEKRRGRRGRSERRRINSRARTRVLAPRKTHVRVPRSNEGNSPLWARLQQVAFKSRTFRTPAYFRFSLSTRSTFPFPPSLSLSLNFSPSLLFVRRCSNAMKINIAFFFSNFVSQTILVSRDCRGLIVTTNLPADKSSFSFFEELSLSSRSDSRDFLPPFSATFRLRCDRRP